VSLKEGTNHSQPSLFNLAAWNSLVERVVFLIKRTESGAPKFFLTLSLPVMLLALGTSTRPSTVIRWTQINVKNTPGISVGAWRLPLDAV
jgi:hypothetical protein